MWINDGYDYPPGDVAGRIKSLRPDLVQTGRTVFGIVQHDTAFEGQFFGIHHTHGTGIHPPLLQLRRGDREPTHVVGNQHILAIRTKGHTAQSVATVGQLNILDFFERSQIDHRQDSGHVIDIGPLCRQEVGHKEILAVLGDHGTFRLTQHGRRTEHDAALGIHFRDRVGELVQDIDFAAILREQRRGGTRSDGDGALDTSRAQVDHIERPTLFEGGDVDFLGAVHHSRGHTGRDLFESPGLDRNGKIGGIVDSYGFIPFVGGYDAAVGEYGNVGRKERSVFGCILSRLSHDGAGCMCGVYEVPRAQAACQDNPTSQARSQYRGFHKSVSSLGSSFQVVHPRNRCYIPRLRTYNVTHFLPVLQTVVLIFARTNKRTDPLPTGWSAMDLHITVAYKTRDHGHDHTYIFLLVVIEAEGELIDVQHTAGASAEVIAVAAGGGDDHHVCGLGFEIVVLQFQVELFVFGHNAIVLKGGLRNDSRVCRPFGCPPPVFQPDIDGTVIELTDSFGVFVLTVTVPFGSHFGGSILIPAGHMRRATRVGTAHRRTGGRILEVGLVYTGKEVTGGNLDERHVTDGLQTGRLAFDRFTLAFNRRTVGSRVDGYTFISCCPIGVGGIGIGEPVFAFLRPVVETEVGHLLGSFGRKGYGIAIVFSDHPAHLIGGRGFEPRSNGRKGHITDSRRNGFPSIVSCP